MPQPPGYVTLRPHDRLSSSLSSHFLSNPSPFFLTFLAAINFWRKPSNFSLPLFTLSSTSIPRSLPQSLVSLWLGISYPCSSSVFDRRRLRSYFVVVLFL